MSINQRITKLISHYRLTQNDFALSISAKQNQVANWLSGEKVPAARLIDIVIAYKDLNARWLITGEGEMLNDESCVVREPVGSYVGGIDPQLKEAWKECGVLTERVRCLEEELQKHKHGGKSQDSRNAEARAG